MKATGYHYWEFAHLYEWRVKFDVGHRGDEELAVVNKWVQENINCSPGVDYRVSWNGDFVAFLDEDDAIMVYLAFA